MTEVLKQQSNYKLLYEWGIKNGVILKGVDLPAAFGSMGISGVIATEDLKANQAVICVPYSIIITQEKARGSILRQVYAEYPDLFDEDETTDSEFNVLSKKKKGEKSFYYPYLNAIQSKNTLLEWGMEQLCFIEDRLLLEEFLSVKRDMELLWEKMQQILKKFVNIFGEPEEEDKENFYWASQSVMSRCFGWSLKSTCMVPIADFLNHSNEACTHYVVQACLERGETLKHLEGTEIEDAWKQYKPKKDKIDLSIVGVKQDNLDDIWRFDDPKIQFINKNKVFLEDRALLDYERKETKFSSRELINQINYNAMKKYSNIQIWDLSFVTSSDSEDNDSDEEIEEFRQKQMETLKEKELASKVQVISDRNVVKVRLNQNSDKMVSIIGLPKDQIQKMVQTDQQLNLDQFLTQKIEKKEQKEEKEQKDDDKEEKQQNEEKDTKQKKDEKQKQEKQKLKQKNNESDSDDSEDSQWDWLQENDQETYFAICTTLPIMKNEQVTVSYGRRTNRFLLGWYGFALPNNKYSSYNFRLWLNFEQDDMQKEESKLFERILIQRLVTSEDWEIGHIEWKGNSIPVTQISKEFRLKKTKLCDDLFSYMRLYLMSFYKCKEGEELLITIPSSLEYEIFVLQFVIGLLNYLLQQYSQPLSDDLIELQSKDLKYQKRFAVYVNKENKEILMNQIMMTLDAIIILKQFRSGVPFKQAYLEDHGGDLHKFVESRRKLKQYLKDASQGFNK